MTPQEHQMLDDFLQRLSAVKGITKDPEAERLIRQRLADQPDASYLLVQRCLLQQQALENAKNEIARLQSQAGPQSGGSFLGGNQQTDWGRSSQATPPPPTPMASTPGVQGAAPQAAAAGSRVPSFLSSAATTAAGVAGGMFLFEGIESLIGGHGHGFGSGGQPEVIQENIVQNNYYESDDDGYDDSDTSYFDDSDMGGDDGGWI